MFHIAAGVCLGILAAVIVLNWWQAHLVRRAERRERKAYRKMTRAYEKAAQEAAREAEYRANCEAEHQAYRAENAKPVAERAFATFYCLIIGLSLAIYLFGP